MTTESRATVGICLGLVALSCATALGSGPVPSLPVLRPYSDGPPPFGKDRHIYACEGGDRNGLICMVCDGGTRDQEYCTSDGSCNGGTCLPSATACPGLKPDGADATCTIDAPWPVERFVPLRALVEAGTAVPTALRVTMISVPSNPQIEGQTRWVDAPVAHFEGDDLTPQFGTFWGARTACTATLFDWTTLGDFWIYGEEIHPESLYGVQHGDAACVATIEGGGSDACLSAPLYVVTGAHGDNAAPFAAFTGLDQPDISDCFGPINKFLALSALTKPRVMHKAELIPRVDEKVDVFDFLGSIDGFLGLPYELVGAADPNRCTN